MKKNFLMCVVLLSAGLLAEASPKDKALMDELIALAQQPTQKKIIFQKALVAIKNGANPNLALQKPPYNGWTLLHFAAEIGDAFVVQELLKNKKTNINSQTAKNKTALHLAVARRNRDIVKKLLQAGANTTKRDFEGNTVASLVKKALGKDVIDETDPELAQEMLEMLQIQKMLSTVKPQQSQIEPELEEAKPVTSSQREITKPLEKPLDQQEEKQIEQEEVLPSQQFYVQPSSTITMRADVPQSAIVSKKIQEVVKKKIQATAQQQAEEEALQRFMELLDTFYKLPRYKKEAEYKSFIKQALELIKLGVNPNIKFEVDRTYFSGNMTVLHIAIEHNDVDSVKKLLQHPDIDVNAQGRFQYTPLHWAVEKSNLEIVKLLLEHPIDFDLKSRDSRPIEGIPERRTVYAKAAVKCGSDPKSDGCEILRLIKEALQKRDVARVSKLAQGLLIVGRDEEAETVVKEDDRVVGGLFVAGRPSDSLRVIDPKII